MKTMVGTKQLLLNIAKELFFSKGYGNTSVQNIIDKAEIAKGTFYHYFKSKDDLLNQMTNNEISNLYNHLNKIVNSQMNAIEKLNTLFQSASNWKSENISIMKVLVAAVMSDSNIQLRHTMLKQTEIQMVPLYASIINQGVTEGSFNVTDAEYAARFIMTSLSINGEEMQKFLLADKFTEELLVDFEKLLNNFENMMERILGAKAGTIHIIEDVVLKKLLTGLLEA